MNFRPFLLAAAPLLALGACAQAGRAPAAAESEYRTVSFAISGMS